MQNMENFASDLDSLSIARVVECSVENVNSCI